MSRTRSPEQIFSDMHRQLRSFDSQVPQSPERLDPLIRIFLQLYSYQLAGIDDKLHGTWQYAAGALIRSLTPECSRWPIPAHTVVRCRPIDPVVEVDTHTRFFYKEKREGGRTLFFSPLKNERVFAAGVKHIFLRRGDRVIDLSPRPPGAAPVTPPADVRDVSADPGQLYVAVEYGGRPADLAGAVLFLKASLPIQRRLRWARWYPGSHQGSFYEDCGFCPGLTSSIDDVVGVDGDDRDRGGLRTGAELFGPLEDGFVTLPESFAVTWEMGPPDPRLLDGSGISSDALRENHYWVRLDLPTGGDWSDFKSPLDICFDALIAVNKNELKLFKHTGSSRLVEVELPEPIADILDITGVVDTDGREYVAVHQIHPDHRGGHYSLEDRQGKLVLWFDFAAGVDQPPDSISVTYTVTEGVSANGIAAGEINELYESHPGIESVENVIPTTGAVPARTEAQIITEVASRLRNRDRALSFPELVNWTLTFDPRIINAECSNGVERGPRGVRRCIVVRVNIEPDRFHCEDEVNLLRKRLTSFLKSRSPVNTQFQVEILRP